MATTINTLEVIKASLATLTPKLDPKTQTVIGALVPVMEQHADLINGMSVIDVASMIGTLGKPMGTLNIDQMSAADIVAATNANAVTLQTCAQHSEQVKAFLVDAAQAILLVSIQLLVRVVL